MTDATSRNPDTNCASHDHTSAACGCDVYDNMRVGTMTYCYNDDDAVAVVLVIITYTGYTCSGAICAVFVCKIAADFRPLHRVSGVTCTWTCIQLRRGDRLINYSAEIIKRVHGGVSLLFSCVYK